MKNVDYFVFCVIVNYLFEFLTVFMFYYFGSMNETQQGMQKLVINENVWSKYILFFIAGQTYSAA